MKKHAVCILAHKNWSQLDDLIDTLNDPLIDIFLHIDLKSRDKFDKHVDSNNSNRYNNVKILKSKRVSWGGYSQLCTELNLFREVLKNEDVYSYVHLISGQDYPLMPVEQIINICNTSKVDYLGYITGNDKNRYIRRLRYYHILVSQVRTSILCAYVRKIFLLLQMLLGVNRLRNCPLSFEVGANWMSITIESLKYIVNEYPKYASYFKYGISTEECYKQMILKTRKDAHIVNNCKRFVVFEHLKSSPKTLTMDMLDEIVASRAFFARKFDDEIDKDIRLAIKKLVRPSVNCCALK